MISDTRFAYEELNALCADFLAAPTSAARRQLLAALRQHLHTRCRRCGLLLPPATRRSPTLTNATPTTSLGAGSQDVRDELDGLCERCLADYIPPPPPGYPGASDDTDVPF